MPRNTSDKFKTARQKRGKKTMRMTVNTIVKRTLGAAGVTGASRNMIMARAYSARGTGELGFVDLASATYGINTTGTIALLNTVPQGAGTSQRVGKRYTLSSLQCRGFAYNLGAAVLNDCVMIIVYDKRPTGVLPAITDILNAANSNAQNNDNNVPDRFQILKRMHWVMSGNNSTPATGNEIKDVDFYMPMRLPVVCKSAGTGAIGDIEQGALYVVTVGNNASGTSAAQMDCTFRVRFIDT